jgi:HlyD family secretion protein
MPEVETYTFTGKTTREILLDLAGFVVPRTKVVISPLVGGIVAQVHLPSEGQQVKAGALLFEVEDTRYRSDYLQAEAGLTAAKAKLLELENGSLEEEKRQALASLEQAKAEVGVAAAELKRVRKLHAQGASTGTELDKALLLHVEAQMRLKLQQAKYDLSRKGPRAERIAAARAEVQQAQAGRDRAKFIYDHTKIYAPTDGTGTSFTVLERKVARGESIQADLTYTALCTLADLTQMEAEIDVQERDLGVLKIGGPCEIIPDAYSDRVYRGRVNRKQPIINRQRGAVQVKITIDNPDEYLLPDMNARVLLLKNEPSAKADKELPEIPRCVLVPGVDAPTVFLFDGQTARLRRIELGATAGDRVQVRQGLLPGDKIILPGDQPLLDGQPVRLRGESKGDHSEQRGAL